MRLKAIAVMAGVALCATLSASLHAADYPTKTITIVVPYPPGGPTDIVARTLANSMERTLKQPVVVDNTSGAGGTVGSAKVARSPNDGYWLLLNNIGMATTPSLYRSLPYKPDDFTPIGLVATMPTVIIARKDLPANNLDELLAYIKKDPTKVNYGHSGIGSAAHLCGLLYQSAIKTRVTTIAYKGAAPAMTDIMSGQFDFMCEQTSSTVPFVESGKVKAMAVTSKKRLAQLPDVPTTAESGLAALDIGVWHGVYAPKGTSKEVVDRLSAALGEALRDPAVQKRYAEIGAVIAAPEEGQPAPLMNLQQAEAARWAPIIKAAAEYAD
ncbi:tripartite tricarboxylate transporter substrate-binding protein [Variovorax sp. J2P1-59]|uniref:Bug family tripartite tricarboxylate transporter substrate binding protein n=1 Tax=Variovorax flavidus TaxID=3053501 RepID=UPI002578A264|nr:tripartite tricarboxylate transporter substrate-binding protein [Variovorax sp. J2P1-59]MDM0074445.1 tripartite tricarboxylate transporter substrate-binding protein [Variovorax sp. J2P1-59]